LQNMSQTAMTLTPSTAARMLAPVRALSSMFALSQEVGGNPNVDGNKCPARDKRRRGLTEALTGSSKRQRNKTSKAQALAKEKSESGLSGGQLKRGLRKVKKNKAQEQAKALTLSEATRTARALNRKQMPREIASAHDVRVLRLQETMRQTCAPNEIDSSLKNRIVWYKWDPPTGWCRGRVSKILRDWFPQKKTRQAQKKSSLEQGHNVEITYDDDGTVHDHQLDTAKYADSIDTNGSHARGTWLLEKDAHNQ
jgi:hypothetical protein